MKPEMTANAWFDMNPGHGDAGVRLFCFSHAGGDAALYARWRDVLAPEIEVCPVILPGRGVRWREAPYRRMNDLANPLFDALLPAVDRPFGFFGHSMGAVIAYEMARRFAAVSAEPPRCLIVSGRQQPFLPSRLPSVYGLSADQLLARMSLLNGTPMVLLQNQELAAAYLPGLRADLELNESYCPTPDPMLDIQMAAFLGDHDPIVKPADMLGWRELTTGQFDVMVFPGDHFYLAGARPDVLGAVRNIVLGKQCPISG
jgi:surfactin synthase thioesterase subunit